LEIRDFPVLLRESSLVDAFQLKTCKLFQKIVDSLTSGDDLGDSSSR